MIREITQILRSLDFEDAESENIQIAKGKYRTSTSLSLVKRQRKWRKKS